MQNPVLPVEALARLREGNERFASGTRSLEAFVSQSRLHEFADGQAPFAVVLTCSDSRVPVEMIFDQGIGDLFVIRVAGNVVAPSLVGSVEYAASVLGAQLAVVMGHTGCGAVKATLEVMRGSTQVPSDNIRDIVERIRPSAESVVATARDLGGAKLSEERLLEQTIRANVRASADHLRHGSRVLEQLVLKNELQVVGAEYDLRTGRVEFLEASG
jgi:carbonic anhydrase